MPLPPGTRLGVYEVIALIGEGGMGQVYRARDAKLNRDVALKILPDGFATDPDRLARFRREAQVLASVNHANIAAIYGLEEGPAEAGRHISALVMEMVEGEDLAQRIARGAIPLDEALPIAKQIADALETAHEQGIVHRDLKPANVKVRMDGTVKVLDFGLAKALDPSQGDGSSGPRQGDPSPFTSPTLTARATHLGMILGTAAYMAPEQAKGKAVDRRADIWAFGAVLYEMLTARRAFEGEDISDTLVAVLSRDADFTALPADTPARLRALLLECLVRDPKQRLRDIGDARIAIERAISGAPDKAIAGPPAAATVTLPPLWRRAMPAVLSAIVTAALVGTATWYLSLKPSAPLLVTRFPFALPDGQAFTSTVRRLLAVSPDGTQMVYVANTRLYLRSMSDLNARPIQGTESFGAVTDPVFSPDGRSIAFRANSDSTIKKIAVVGGAAVTICPADQLYGMSWGSDGIVFGQGAKGVLRVSPNGGKPDVLVSVKDGEVAHGPQVLPDGQHVLFTLATGTASDMWDKAQVVVQSLTSGERKPLIAGGSDARYVPTGLGSPKRAEREEGHLVYALSGNVFAVAFDAQRLEVKGGPVPMVEGVRRSSGGGTGAADFSVSSTGTLIYIPGPVSATGGQLDIALIDRKGNVEPLRLTPAAYLWPRVSPDGTHITFGTDDGREATVWVYDLSGGKSMLRLTYGKNNRFPVWSADSRHVAFQSDREGDLAIWWQPADGTGTAERLTKPEPGTSHVPNSWSKGDVLLFDVVKGTDASLSIFDLKDRKTTPFDAVHSENSSPTGAVFSPDGKWVAYVSSQTAVTTTVYVQPFPGAGAKYQLFAKGGDAPHEVVWSPDGKELFYNPRVSGFEAVSVTTQPSFAFGNAVPVPRTFQLSAPTLRRAYDITPGGKFVGLITPGQTDSGTSAALQIQVVLNWLEELKQRAPTRSP